MLLTKAILFLLVGMLFVGILVFLPAGTLSFHNGWLLMGVLFIPMLLMGVVMFFRAPDLLQKRLNHKEKQGEQKAVVSLSALMFLCSFVVSGLDFRFGWSAMPKWLIVLSAVLFLAGYAMYAEVLRENAYLSRTVEVQAGQKVVSTGLYGVVRHPMYSATLLMFLSMPLILGSWWGLIIQLVYPALIIVRLQAEERLLVQELDGYAEYRQKVKFRLIPGIW
ncbi:MAG: isoprenylcysteine carboxylmethyltransferase family protein [bacterium]|nr:isoprenylcysteine carboxylmethyltransferase family protein [bacterium]